MSKTSIKYITNFHSQNYLQMLYKFLNIKLWSGKWKELKTKIATHW